MTRNIEEKESVLNKKKTNKSLKKKKITLLPRPIHKEPSIEEIEDIEKKESVLNKKKTDKSLKKKKITLLPRPIRKEPSKDSSNIKQSIEKQLSVKDKLRYFLMKVREIHKKTMKSFLKEKLSDKKNLLNEIKNENKKTFLNGKTLLNQIKSKAKENSFAEKNIIDQIKSKEKSNCLAEKKIVDQINNEKKNNRLAEKKIIDQIKKILDQINNEEKKKSSNENKQNKKKGLEDIKNISDEKKKRAKKSIEKRKNIYNEKRKRAKKSIEERKKIYDEKKQRVKKSIEEIKNIYNEKKKRAKKIVEEKKKIYNEKNFIAKKLILEKETLFSKKKIKAFQNIKKTKIFCKMWEARLRMGEGKRRWNPKTAPYVFTTIRLRYYKTIDLVQTYKHLKKVLRFLYKAASKKKTVLFVGTKTHQSSVILKAAAKANSFFINQRWLGGILTNWKTIKRSNKRFRSITLRERLKTIPLHLKLKEIYRNIVKKQKSENPNFLLRVKKIVLLFQILKDEDSDSERFNLLKDKKKSTLLKYKKELEVTTSQFKSQGLQLLKNPYFQSLPKKQAATKQRQKERFKKYLNGLTRIIKIPDIVIILGQPVESNAVRECQRLGIKSITVLDTDCDPDLTGLFVPANDDATCSIKFLLTFFSKAIQKGQKKIKKEPKQKKKKKKYQPWFARKRKRGPKNKKMVFSRLYKIYKKYRSKMPTIPKFLEFVP